MRDVPPMLLLEFADADARLDGALSASFAGSYDQVLLFDGDLRVEGDFLDAVVALAEGPFDLVVVRGDLAVAGCIALYDSTPGLLVTGRTTAETLEGGDCEISLHDGAFQFLVYGYYNDGVLDLGEIETPWVINANHDLRMARRAGTRWVDNHGDDPEYDYCRTTIAASFVPEVIDPEDGDCLDVYAFLEALRAGRPVLRGA